MSPQQKSLDRFLEDVRSRIRARRALMGAALTVGVAAALLVLMSLAAYYFGHNRAFLLLLRILPVVALPAAVWLLIVRPFRRPTPDIRIARFIEERRGLADRLVTSVEFGQTHAEPQSHEGRKGASAAIVNRLVKDAGSRASEVKLDNVVDLKRSWAYGGSAALGAIALVLFLLGGPRPISEGMATLYSPLGNSVFANSMFISVLPGNAKAPRGSDQKIRASLTGFDSETAEIFIQKAGTSGWMALQMEPAKASNQFQHFIFNIQESVQYYIESGGIRSPEFSLEVADRL